MFDAGRAAPQEAAPIAPESHDGKSATTLAVESRKLKASKRARRTLADVRRAATAVKMKERAGLSVFGDRRIAASDADQREHAARIAARSYHAMPVIKPTNPKSTTPRRWQNLLTERHQYALADLADHAGQSKLLARVERNRRNGRPPSRRDRDAIAAALKSAGDVTPSERPMIRWQSQTIPIWLAEAFRDMREIPTRQGLILRVDPRPQFLLWFYGGANEFQHLIARHAARSALYFAHVALWHVSNAAVSWAVHDAIERVLHGSAAIRQRMQRQQAGPIGGRAYENDADRAAFVSMEPAQFVRLRSIAERAIWKALRNSMLAFMEVCGKAHTTKNVILSMSTKTLAKG